MTREKIIKFHLVTTSKVHLAVTYHSSVLLLANRWQFKLVHDEIRQKNDKTNKT